MTEGDKVFGSPPPWTDEMHERWLKELKEMRPISTSDDSATSLEQIIDNLTEKAFKTRVPGVKDTFTSIGENILEDLLKEQQEVVSSPIRFNGVSIEKIKQVFEKYGIILEQEF